jgi:hypothetical protein
VLTGTMRDQISGREGISAFFSRSGTHCRHCRRSGGRNRSQRHRCAINV